MIKRELLIGLPVMEKKSGKQIGSIKDLCLTEDGQAVAGFLVTGGGWSRKNFNIPFNKIESIGPHAIIIDSLTEEENNNAWTDRCAGKLMGLQVMTSNGSAVGTISDIIIDPADGTIQSMELSDGLVDDFIKGRSLLPWYPPGSSERDVYIISDEHANEISSYNKGIKNIFLNTL